MEGVERRIEDRRYFSGPCPCCGRVEPEPEALEPYGVSRDRTGTPVLILFHCPCRTSRSLRWEDAPAALRRKAESWSSSKGADRTR